MRYDRRLDKVYLKAHKIQIDDTSKLVIMSDCHRGNGEHGDNFAGNEHLYFCAMEEYYKNGFTYFELGDGDELWENRSFKSITGRHNTVFWLLGKFFKEGRLHMIYGNHDMVKKNKKWVKNNLESYTDERTMKQLSLFPGIIPREAISLSYKRCSREIVLLHGHQVDPLNSTFWHIARFLVRYFWEPLETWGVCDPTRAAKNNHKKHRTEQRLSYWAKKRGKLLIAGHTHRPMLPSPVEGGYFNDGSTVHPRCITCIEIEEGKICLAKWSICTREDRTFFVCREILAEKVPLENFFENM